MSDQTDTVYVEVAHDGLVSHITYSFGPNIVLLKDEEITLFYDTYDDPLKALQGDSECPYPVDTEIGYIQGNDNLLVTVYVLHCTSKPCQAIFIKYFQELFDNTTKVK